MRGERKSNNKEDIFRKKKKKGPIGVSTPVYLTTSLVFIGKKV